MNQTPQVGVFFCPDRDLEALEQEMVMIKILRCVFSAVALAAMLQGCTVLAIADAAGSAVVYGVKTTVNVLDAVTPDIINKKK